MDINIINHADDSDTAMRDAKGLKKRERECDTPEETPAPRSETVATEEAQMAAVLDGELEDLAKKAEAASAEASKASQEWLSSAKDGQQFLLSLHALTKAGGKGAPHLAVRVFTQLLLDATSEGEGACDFLKKKRSEDARAKAARSAVSEAEATCERAHAASLTSDEGFAAAAAAAKALKPTLTAGSALRARLPVTTSAIPPRPSTKVTKVTCQERLQLLVPQSIPR